MPSASTFGYREKGRSISATDDWYEKPPQVWARELERQVRAASLRRMALRRAALAYMRRKEEEKRFATARTSGVELVERFRTLVDRWRKETAHISSISKLVMHPSYQRIIGMGPAVIPIILRELQRDPDYWFWALTSITGEDPVNPEDIGDIPKMAEAWLKWGRDHDYI
jgi:hypothetical protein